MPRQPSRFPAHLLLLCACGADELGPDGGSPGDDSAVAEDATAEGSVESIFVVPRDDAPGGFFDLPYPSDLRRTEAGGIDLGGFPNPVGSAQIDLLVELLREEVDGFSTNGTAYLRFTGAVDQTLLPGPEASLDVASPVFLVELGSGVRLPLEMRVQASSSDYWADSTLAVRTVSGFVLEPAARYALVVTSGLLAADGTAVGRAADLSAVLGIEDGDEATDDARDRVYGPAVERLEELGTPRESIVSLAVFTTMDPVSAMFRAAEALRQNVDAPQVTELFRDSEGDGFTVIVGRYGPAPFYQSGAEPFDELGSGRMIFEDGEPVLQREDELRFALAVPNGGPPPDGFPLALYSHGTGGTYKSFIEDGTAGRLAALGIASIGFDQVLHGERAPEGTQPENTFFNFLNPVAGRDNARQAALDNVQQARLATSLVVASNLLPGNDDAFFDAGRQVFFGHSQGGLNGSLFLAIDDTVRGGVLSGTGGGIGWAILLKKEPTDILALVTILLDLDAEREAFDIYHPLLMVLQTFIDPADPLSYARHWYASARAGSGRSILQTEGLLDEFAPTPGIEALAVAGRLPLVDPVAQPILGLELLGLDDFAPPITGNVEGDDGQPFTAGLLQVPDSGHHAVFDDPEAAATAVAFVRSVAESPPGTIE